MGSAGGMEVPGCDQLELVTQTGLAQTYRAVRRLTSAAVAVRVWPVGLPDERLRRRFLRDAQQAGHLPHHPARVRIEDAGFTPDGRPFVVTGPLPRVTLADALPVEGPMPVGAALRLGVEIADALAAAHEAGEVHSRIDPSVVFLGPGSAMLADLGTASLTDALVRAAGPAPRPRYFTAPEQLERGAVGPASDVYSLAAVVYAALAGRAPHERSEPGAPESAALVLLRTLQSEVPAIVRADAPADVTAVLRQALAPDPSARTPSAQAFATALLDLQRTHGVGVTVPAGERVAAAAHRPAVGEHVTSARHLSAAGAGPHPTAGAATDPSARAGAVAPPARAPAAAGAEPSAGAGAMAPPVGAAAAGGNGAPLASVEPLPAELLPVEALPDLEGHWPGEAPSMGPPADAPTSPVWSPPPPEPRRRDLPTPSGRLPADEPPAQVQFHPIEDETPRPAEMPPAPRLLAPPGPPAPGIPPAPPLPTPRPPGPGSPPRRRPVGLIVGALGVAVAGAVALSVLSGDDPSDPADPGGDPPSGAEAPGPVPTGLGAVESAAGVQLDWEGEATATYAVLVMSETSAPTVLVAEDGPSLLVPSAELRPEVGYCFAVADMAALDASGGDTESAFGPPVCVRGASEATVRPQ